MARKTVKRKAASKRGSARKARRSTRPAKRPAKRVRPASRARAAPRAARRKTRLLRTVAVPPGEAADRPSLLEGLDVDPAPPTERDASEWDGLDNP